MNQILDFSSPEPLSTPHDLLTARGLPAEYFARHDGIWMESEDCADMHICGPIAVKALGRAAGGGGWCNILAFDDRDGTQTGRGGRTRFLGSVAEFRRAL